VQDTEQTLLCLNYDFAKDWEMDREEAFKQLGRAKDVKRWWNYNTLFKGVRILVAYEGASPVGTWNTIRSRYAPRREGENLTFVTCMFVQPKHRWHGVGAHLIEECEEKAREHTGGLAVIAYPDSLFMPAGFFIEHGFAVVQESDCAWLLMKAWQNVKPPNSCISAITLCLFPPIELRSTSLVRANCPFWAHARDD
jgi:GNAT superfamily N-acetyltransferase